MERRPGAAEVGPLGHRLEVVHRFGGLNLYRPHQLVAAFGRREHEIRKYLNLPDPDRHGLILADVRHHIVPALQSDLQETDDAIVLELLTDGTDQYWAHITYRPETGSAVGAEKNREL